MRITERSAKSVSVPEKGQAIYFDDDVKGFGVRVTAKGSRSWIVEVRRGVWFARRFRHRGSGKLIHAQIERDNVHAFFQGRREAEVVASDVEVLKIENLKGDNLPMV
jgi:hypothetical protein